MIFITHKLDTVLQREEGKFNLNHRINEKSFRRANTPFSYRRINTLSKDKLFPEERNNKKGWRKFSLKELIYFKIVFELKMFGVSHGNLKSLADSFFNEETAEIAIICVLIQAEIMLTIKSDGKVTYYDPPHYLLIGREETPTIQIRLNDIVNAVRKANNEKPFPIKWSGRNYFWNKENISISNNEKYILNIIRSKNYHTIKLKTNDGKASLIQAGKVVDPKQLSSQELVRIVEKKAYQEIGIITENGKIVSFKTEEKFKL